MEKTSTYKTAIYLRLSRDDGDNKESQSISNQRKSIYEYIKKSNKDKFVIIDEYVDDGYSGTNFNRPDFKRLLEDIETKKINCIITKDLSRLGRDHILTGYYIENFFTEKDIRYIAINDNIDSKEEDSFDMLSFRLAFNDFYPKDTSKKILKVKKLKAEKGEYQGSHPPFGYKKSTNEKNKLIIDEEEAKIVRKIFDLYESGKSSIDIVKIFYKEGIKTPAQYSNIAKYMKGNDYWQKSSIIKILKNETYIGSVIGHTTTTISYKTRKTKRVPKDEWIVIPNMHEPIISPSQFKKVQEIMKTRMSVRNRKYDHIFKGIVKCGHCGSNMTIKPDCRTNDIVNISFICSHKNQSKTNCDNPTIRAKIITEQVLNDLRNQCKKIILNKEELEKISNQVEAEVNVQKYEIQKEINKLNAKINKLDMQINSIYNDKLDNIIKLEDFLQIYENKNNEREKLQKEKNELQNKLQEDENAQGINYENLKKYANEFLKMENPTKELIRSLIDTITISKGRRIKIKYKFSKI